MKTKITLLKACIIVGYIGVPLSTCALFYYSARDWGHIIFLIFMLCHSFERVWETFYTTKERRVNELHGDWTLAVVTLAYLVLCFLTIAETFIFVKRFRVCITILGLCLYVLAFLLRWWGMKALGKQWAIHAVGAQKIKKVRLIKIGPFKYVRHPIYLAIIIEVISIPTIANTPWCMLFAISINVPLQIVRLVLEEKSSIRRFGDKYLQYQQEVSQLLPIKYMQHMLFSKK